MKTATTETARKNILYQNLLNHHLKLVHLHLYKNKLNYGTTIHPVYGF